MPLSVQAITQKVDRFQRILAKASILDQRSTF